MFDFTENTEVADIASVPDQFKGMYSEKEGGGGFVVAPHSKGAVEAMIGLNKALSAARTEATNSKGKAVDLSVLKEYGETPDAIAEAVKSKMTDFTNELAKGKDAKLNLDKIREELATGHANDLKTKDTRIEALTGQLYQHLVSSAALSALVEYTKTPEFVMPILEPQIKVVEEEGKVNVFVVDQAGDRRYSSVTGQPMSIAELVKEMRDNPKYGRLFDSEERVGAGVTPGSMGTRNKTDAVGEKRSAVDKIAAGLKARQARR